MVFVTVCLPYFRVCFVGRVNPRFPVVVQVSGGLFFLSVCLVAVVAAG